MSYPAGLRYTKTHEWLHEVEGKSASVGITDYAQHSLGDIVFVELPKVGDAVSAGTPSSAPSNPSRPSATSTPPPPAPSP